MELDHRQADVGTAPGGLEAPLHEADVDTSCRPPGGRPSRPSADASGIEPLNTSSPALDWENIYTITVQEHVQFDLLADFEYGPDPNGSARSANLDNVAHQFIADLTSHDGNAVDAFARDYGAQSMSYPQSWASLWDNDTPVADTTGPGNVVDDTTGLAMFNDLTLPDLNEFAGSPGGERGMRPQHGASESTPQSSCASTSTFPESDRTRKHLCPTCGIAFRYPKDVRRHAKSIHIVDKSLKCPHKSCKRYRTGFSRKDALKRHMKTHVVDA